MMESNSKDKIIFFAKTDLSKPLSDHSKYIQDLAETDPENPGISLSYERMYIYICICLYDICIDFFDGLNRF